MPGACARMRAGLAPDRRRRRLRNSVGRNGERALPHRRLGEIIEIAAEMIVGRIVDDFRIGLAGVPYDRPRLAHALSPAILAEDGDTPAERRLDGGAEHAA